MYAHYTLCPHLLDFIDKHTGTSALLTLMFSTLTEIMKTNRVDTKTKSTGNSSQNYCECV